MRSVLLTNLRSVFGLHWQRLQMHKSKYLNVRHCAKSIWRQEGLRGFYASYSTTVLMNVPFMAIHFASYESLKRFLVDTTRHDGTMQHLLAGAGAGALGGMVSNPLGTNIIAHCAAHR